MIGLEDEQKKPAEISVEKVDVVFEFELMGEIEAIHQGLAGDFVVECVVEFVLLSELQRIGYER